MSNGQGNYLSPIWIKPTWPEDTDASDDAAEVLAREATLQQANSPSPHYCLLDDIWDFDQPLHAHDFADCMKYRFAYTIGDQDPWTYWTLYDTWEPTWAPAVPQPAPITGWQPRARVNPRGISQVDGWNTNWWGWTFATMIAAPVIIPIGSGVQTRIHLMADCVFDSVCIGPVSATGPLVADVLYPLTFGGQPGVGPDAEFLMISDPLPQGIDAPNGLLITGYVDADPTVGNGNMGTRGFEPGWLSGWSQGDTSMVLDHSQDTPSPWSSLAVIIVEGFYVAPAPSAARRTVRRNLRAPVRRRLAKPVRILSRK